VDFVFSLSITSQFRIQCYPPAESIPLRLRHDLSGVIDPEYTIHANALIFLARSTAC
jgi:hypothetical protein